MPSSPQTILILGGTSGIGEALARRLHAQGNHLILTGRRTSRLDALRTALPGLQTYPLDLTDLAALPTTLSHLFTTYPAIDTVWLNAGVMNPTSITTPVPAAQTTQEITLNLTAAILVAQLVVPHLLARNTPTTLMLTSSAIGFVPNGLFPVYSATKAGIHAFCVAIRQTLKESKVQVIELVPPFVDGTELGEDWPPEVVEKLKAVTPLPMGEFVDQVVEVLEGEGVREVKEIAPGTAGGRVKAWRDGVGEILVKSGMGG